MTSRFRFVSFLAAISALAVAGSRCSSSANAPSGNTSATPAKAVAPVSRRSKDPRVVEETDAYFIERYKKDELIRVDDTHVQLPMMPRPFVIYREDDDYYYIRTEKYTPEEIAAEKAQKKESVEKKRLYAATVDGKPVYYDPADFSKIDARPGKKFVKFAKAGSGLPVAGQFRENIFVADMNGDGHPDIVTTFARVSTGLGFHLYLGDGKGNFAEANLKFVDSAGKPARPSGAYGGVTVADFNGDGKPDVATAAHGHGIRVYLQKADLTFEVVDKGLPANNFSGQALIAADADGDGRPDLIVSKDQAKTGPKDFDPSQVELFLNRDGGKRWEARPDAIVKAVFSKKVVGFDPDGDGSVGFATGSDVYYGTNLIWRLKGKSSFEVEKFDEIEPYAFHFAVAPGHFGAAKLPAIAGFYAKSGGRSGLQAKGANVYVHEKDGWKKHIVFRDPAFGGSFFVGIAMGDLDGDGLDDVVIPDTHEKKLRIFFQNSDGSFEEMPSEKEPDISSPPADVRLADLTGSGRLDIVLSSTVYSNRPEATGGLFVFLNGGPGR